MLVLAHWQMIERPIHLEYAHRIAFTRDAFAVENSDLAHVFARTGESEAQQAAQRVLVFVDAGVSSSSSGLSPAIENWFSARDGELELVAAPVVLPGGEACKNDWDLVPRIWEAINDHGIDRHSFVLVIGGGAFLDLVGFAAATAHRGIRLLRMPTTSLSQGDGGVGVKNGVNFFGKKNWVGSFAVPFAVVNDLAFLDSLPDRDRRAGIIEAIKVALVRDSGFFEEIERSADALAGLEKDALEHVIRRSAEIHVDHIATSGDPFELGSARPLDFGHWVAHKLEQVSRFSIGHGEAVAIGIAVDLIYSRRVGMLEPETCERILGLIEAVGFATYDPFIDASEHDKPIILRGLEEFREHLGGELTITLVPEVGRKVEVNEMDEAEILAAIEELKKRSSVTAGQK